MDDESRYYIGTSGWTYEGWRGDFYPTDLARTRWFEYYAHHFNAVEINATFYRSFKIETYQKWRFKATTGFRYALKAPRVITLRKMLVNTAQDILEFSTCAQQLGETLGMVLLQLAPNMALDFKRLRAALQSFHEPSQVAVEFRHSRWEAAETFELLQEMGVAYVCADSPKCTLQARLTGKRGYIRLHGRRVWYADDYSEAELHEIAALAHGMISQGAEAVYIFFNNDIGGYAHRNALKLKEIICQ